MGNNLKFQKKIRSFELILTQLHTAQGASELKSFRKKKDRNSDLVNMLLVFYTQEKNILYSCVFIPFCLPGEGGVRRKGGPVNKVKI